MDQMSQIHFWSSPGCRALSQSIKLSAVRLICLSADSQTDHGNVIPVVLRNAGLIKPVTTANAHQPMCADRHCQAQSSRSDTTALNDYTLTTTMTANMSSRVWFRSASSHHYKTLTTRLKFGERCFSHAGLVCDTRPCEIQDLRDPNSFRCQLKTFLFGLAYDVW